MAHSDSDSSTMRPNPKHLIDFFARSLTSFHSSPDVFRILCTLPHAAAEPVSRRPASGVRRLVVLDSSFNPPTRAHAEMARSALKWASSSSEGTRLMLLLSVNNADKAPKPASFPVRLGMMEGFGRDLLGSLGGEVGAEIDLAVTKMPYFHDKARAIGESGMYSSSSDGQEPEQVFLAGFDTAIRIFNPKYYGDGGMRAALGPFFERARLRVTMRTDDEWGGEDEQREYVRGLGEGRLDEVGGDVAWAGRVDLVEGRGDGVSSSKVREMVKVGEREGLEKLVDGEVMGWIEGEGLYRE
ncbi:Nucleotidylyl transferase [Trichoderma sp. SZMC 28011]